MNTGAITSTIIMPPLKPSRHQQPASSPPPQNTSSPASTPQSKSPNCPRGNLPQTVIYPDHWRILASLGGDRELRRRLDLEREEVALLGDLLLLRRVWEEGKVRGRRSFLFWWRRWAAASFVSSSYRAVTLPPLFELLHSRSHCHYCCYCCRKRWKVR